MDVLLKPDDSIEVSIFIVYVIVSLNSGNVAHDKIVHDFYRYGYVSYHHLKGQ